MDHQKAFSLKLILLNWLKNENKEDKSVGKWTDDSRKLYHEVANLFKQHAAETEEYDPLEKVEINDIKAQ